MKHGLELHTKNEFGSDNESKSVQGPMPLIREALMLLLMCFSGCSCFVVHLHVGSKNQATKQPSKRAGK